MRGVLFLAGVLAFGVVSLRVPVDARDLGYYVNGLIVIVVLGLACFRDNR